jgi:hypothetical protein
MMSNVGANSSTLQHSIAVAVAGFGFGDYVWQRV